MKRKGKNIVALLTVVFLCASFLTGCGSVTIGEKREPMSVQDARKEIDALLTRVNNTEVQNPSLDIYQEDIGENAALADISTFEIAVEGKGAINIEIAAATELSKESPDDWLNVVAKNFNAEKMTINGKVVSVSVRAITSGEIYTYVNAKEYYPNLIIPSSDAWGEMLSSSGVPLTKIADRLAGNTAGILLSKDAEGKVAEKYKEVNFGTVLQAAEDGAIVFGYTNPYTSSTGLNGLTQMLSFWDSENPLSQKANDALLQYQKTAPPVAYTTAVLRNQAKKGIIDAMVMEEQAYVNTPELSGYTYIPFGIRHDHPAYTFRWNSEEEEAVAKLFVEYCLLEKSQRIATEKGFNRHDDYISKPSGLTGQGYITAQAMWKQNKSGGRPVVAVFIADVSGSMNGEPIASLKESLRATLPYIGSENYVGLVSYSSDVVTNLTILDKDEDGKVTGVKAFDDKQRAYFAGEVKNLRAAGGTSTYDAVLVGLDMINKAQEYLPDAVPLIILLTDGAANSGYSLSRISPIVEGMRVPVYCIAYNYKESNGSLQTLSGLNEASTIGADSTDIVNQLRNLFNTQL